MTKMYVDDKEALKFLKEQSKEGKNGVSYLRFANAIGSDWHLVSAWNDDIDARTVRLARNADDMQCDPDFDWEDPQDPGSGDILIHEMRLDAPVEETLRMLKRAVMVLTWLAQDALQDAVWKVKDGHSEKALKAITKVIYNYDPKFGDDGYTESDFREKVSDELDDDALAEEANAIISASKPFIKCPPAWWVID